MSDSRRSILEEVAAGRLTPQQAADQLEDLGEQPSEQAPSVADVPASPQGSVRRIKVIGDFRTAKITGDPDVVEATVDGTHTVSREGDVLVINAQTGEHEAGEWTFRRGPRPRIAIGIGSRPKPISIRMNPALELEVAIDAGAASIINVRGPITGEIDAGAFKIDGFASPLNLSVDAGSVQASGVLDRGDSHIKCDAGSVRITLRKGSSVRVKAKADVGRVVVGPHSATGLHFGDAREHVFGDGAGTLTIEGGIGKITVEEV